VEAVQSSGLQPTLLALLAYSDGSAIADGVEGSAAAVVRIGDEDFSATVRLAAADRALSSGRSEWAGLLMVLCILRRVRADVTLRLDNLQVVNGYGDGEDRFAHDWLRRNERDMATLAWEAAAERERLGFGTIEVLPRRRRSTCSA
jgi:ribonuclease HI